MICKHTTRHGDVFIMITYYNIVNKFPLEKWGISMSLPHGET